MEKWLQGQDHTSIQEHLLWINPLQRLVSRAPKTLAVEVSLHDSITGVGSYAGSSDGLMLVNGDVVLIDSKTKRHGKYVSPRYCEQQRLQLDAYSIAINHLYQDQLPSPVKRTSLSFSHPVDGKPVTDVSTQGTYFWSISKSGLTFFVSGMRFIEVMLWKNKLRSRRNRINLFVLYESILSY